MKKIVTGKTLFWMIVFIAFMFLLYKVFAFGFKEAVHLKYNDDIIMIDEFINRNVTIICELVSTTDNWFAAVAIKNGETFSKLKDGGILLNVVGKNPVVFLNENLTSFYQNRFALTGYISVNEDGEYQLSINKWDIIYPIIGNYNSINERKNQGRLTPSDYCFFGFGILLA